MLYAILTAGYQAHHTETPVISEGKEEEQPKAKRIRESAEFAEVEAGGVVHRVEASQELADAKAEGEQSKARAAAARARLATAASTSPPSKVAGEHDWAATAGASVDSDVSNLVEAEGTRAALAEAGRAGATGVKVELSADSQTLVPHGVKKAGQQKPIANGRLTRPYMLQVCNACASKGATFGSDWLCHRPGLFGNRGKIITNLDIGKVPLGCQGNTCFKDREGNDLLIYVPCPCFFDPNYQSQKTARGCAGYINRWLSILPLDP